MERTTIDGSPASDTRPDEAAASTGPAGLGFPDPAAASPRLRRNKVIRFEAINVLSFSSIGFPLFSRYRVPYFRLFARYPEPDFR